MTGKEVAKMLRLRGKGMSYIAIALEMNTSATTVRRYCQLDGYAQTNKPDRKELAFICSEATCGGCIYFKKLHSTHAAPNFCSYTLDTGRAKDITVPCKKCKVKKLKTEEKKP